MGVRGQQLGDEHYYAQELFETKELTGYLTNMLNTTKSVYENIIYESDVERRFADQLEQNEAVKVYAKLPGCFQVMTPLGRYNADWAVLINSHVGGHLYFVVEIKGSAFLDGLRFTERAKIKYGQAHFKALAVQESPAQYRVTTTVDDLLATAPLDPLKFSAPPRG